MIESWINDQEKKDKFKSAKQELDELKERNTELLEMNNELLELIEHLRPIYKEDSEPYLKYEKLREQLIQKHTKK